MAASKSTTKKAPGALYYFQHSQVGLLMGICSREEHAEGGEGQDGEEGGA